MEQAEQCRDNNDKACWLNAINIPFNGSGIIKNIVHDLNEGMDEKIIDTAEIGTVSGGKIDLDLKLYDNANNPIGSLFLMNVEDTDDGSFFGLWAYYSDDYKYENTRTLSQHGKNYKFVTDIDIKKGWNLIYEKDKDDYENGICLSQILIS